MADLPILDQWPKLAQAYPELAFIERWSGAADLEQHEQALSILEEGLAETSSEPRVGERPHFRAHLCVLKSITYERLGQQQFAVRACVAALRVDPSSASAWSQLGRVLRMMRKEQWSTTCFERALEITRSIELTESPPNRSPYPSATLASYVDLARAKHGKGESEEALQILQQAVDIRPEDPMVAEAIREITSS